MWEKSRTLRALVSERLSAAAEEIFALVERTIAEYEEELRRSREENQRNRRLLDSALRTPQSFTGVQPQSHDEDELESLDAENTETLHIKQEVDDLSIKPEEQPRLVFVAREDEEQMDEDDDEDDEDEWERSVCLPTSPWGTEEDKRTVDGVQPQSHDEDELESLDAKNTETLHIKQEVDDLSIKPEEQPRLVFVAREDEEQTDEDDEEWERSVCLPTSPWGTEEDERRWTERHRATEASKRTAECTGGGPFSCSVCEKTFTQKATLRIHLSTHFDAQNNPAAGRLNECAGETPFHRDVCGKTFRHSESFTSRRTRRHAGTRPFSCWECGARFGKRRNAVGHMSVHAGLLPFACSQCDARFVQKRALVKHMKSH